MVATPALMAHQQSKCNGLSPGLYQALALRIDTIQNWESTQIWKDWSYIVIEGDLATLNTDHDCDCGHEFGERSHSVYCVKANSGSGILRQCALGQRIEFLTCNCDE